MTITAATAKYGGSSMNGRGGNVYNKSSAKRKPSSLVLARAGTTTGGAGVIVSGSSKQNVRSFF